MAFWEKYLLFLWKSTNQHGVHSPFVYRLVTQCFYNTQKFPCKHYPKGISKRKGQFLLRLIAYLKPKSLKVYTDIADFPSLFPIDNTEDTSKEKDLLLLYQCKEFPCAKELLSQMHNDSLLVMVAPHQKENEIFYKQLLENKAFSVVIDTFSFALFFIRKEQEREVFFIRNK